MSALDIFNSDAFSLQTLTAAINNMPYVPGRIGSMGLFRERGVPTISVSIEEKSGQLYLVENQLRGGPARQNTRVNRKIRNLNCTHLPVRDNIPADEIQNVRAFGSEDAAQGIQAEVNERMTTMSLSLDATLEHLMVGAIKGQILDADGSTVIYNLFTEFGVSALADVDFDLDNATPASGAVRKNCSKVIREMEDELGAVPYTSVQALVGKTFMDDLTSHSECLTAFDRWRDGEWMRGQTARRTFQYGGILFEEYRGSVGGVTFIPDTEARFFPVGTPDNFDLYYAPANYVETVNTIGLPKYAKTAIDAQFQKYVALETQSNPLPICTRPRTLRKGTNT